jgi:hypothetical protein
VAGSLRRRRSAWAHPARFSAHGREEPRAGQRTAVNGHGDDRPPTEAIYRRYAIVDEIMLREAAEKLARATRSWAK